MAELRIMRALVVLLTTAIVFISAAPIMGAMSLLLATPPRTFEVRPLPIQKSSFHQPIKHIQPAVVKPLFSDNEEHVYSGWLNDQKVYFGVSNKKAVGFVGFHKVQLGYRQASHAIAGSYDGEAFTLLVTADKINGRIGDVNVSLDVEL